ADGADRDGGDEPAERAERGVERGGAEHGALVVKGPQDRVGPGKQVALLGREREMHPVPGGDDNRAGEEGQQPSEGDHAYTSSTERSSRETWATSRWYSGDWRVSAVRG